MILTTSRGRRLTVESTVDLTGGRVAYRVDRVGTFTIEADTHDPDRGYALHLHYGLHTGGWPSSYIPLPEAPAVNRVPLIGGAVVNPERITEENGWWLVCRRQGPDGYSGGGSVSPATRDATAAIVAALIAHHMARPDREALDAIQRARLAPARLDGLHREIVRLNEEIASREAARAVAMAAADVQAALIPHALAVG